MNAEQRAREIGEEPSCACGCADCGRNIYDLYRIAMDQAAWIRELDKRIALHDGSMVTTSPVLRALVEASAALQKANTAARDAGYQEIVDETRLCALAVNGCISRVAKAQKETA